MRGHNCQEVWVPAYGHQGRYEVSSFGRVRSLVHPRGMPWKCGPKLLQPRVTEEGRERVYLARKDVHIPRLMLLSFVGLPADGQECAHLDGNSRNNVLGNLAWVTHAENMSHQVAHGTRRFGSGHAQAKLSDAQAREIRSMAAAGMNQRVVAEQFNISPSLVSRLHRRVAWRHL